MFKVASYEWHEIKKTHRVIWDGCIWNGISLTNASWVSQSVLCEVLNAFSDDVFKTKCLFNGEIMFYSAFKKDTEKVLLKWKAWYKLLSSSGLYVSILLRGMKYQLRKQLCTFENEIPILFSYSIWFLISEKTYHKVHVSSPWCMHALKVSRRHTKCFLSP